VNPNEPTLQTEAMIEIQCDDRWQVYHRLQELDIVCQCGYRKPLKVQVNDVSTAIQVWSVVQQVTLSRQMLANRLECCWKICSFKENRE
jgi:hypothetical protein